MIKKSISFGALAAVLAGCAAAQTPVPLQSLPPTAAAYCPAKAGEHCQIDVPASDTACMPVPSILQVESGVVINWRLAPSDWEFVSNGIEFKDPAKADKAFEKGRLLTPQHWQVKVRSSPVKGLYDYNVRVRNTRTGKSCTVDPGIWL